MIIETSARVAIATEYVLKNRKSIFKVAGEDTAEYPLLNTINGSFEKSVDGVINTYRNKRSKIETVYIDDDMHIHETGYVTIKKKIHELLSTRGHNTDIRGKDLRHAEEKTLDNIHDVHDKKGNIQIPFRMLVRFEYITEVTSPFPTVGITGPGLNKPTVYAIINELDNYLFDKYVSKKEVQGYIQPGLFKLTRYGFNYMSLPVNRKTLCNLENIASKSLAMLKSLSF